MFGFVWTQREIRIGVLSVAGANRMSENEDLTCAVIAKERILTMINNIY